MSSARYEGRVKFFNKDKGFGFIVFGDQEIFVHATSLPPGVIVDKGDVVGFTTKQARKGMQADAVELIRKAAVKTRREQYAHADY